MRHVELTCDVPGPLVASVVCTVRQEPERQIQRRLNERFSWWALQDLNLRPTDYESAALTTELRALAGVAFDSTSAAPGSSVYNLSMVRSASLKGLAAAAVLSSIALGLVLLGIAWSRGQEQLGFLQSAWPIRGQVVALEPAGGDLSRLDPIVHFTTIQGDEVRRPMPGLGLSPGSTVNLLYDATDPDSFRVNDYWDLWFEPWAFGVAGGLLVLVPLLAVVSERAGRPRREPV